MRTIYRDADFKCHVTNDGTMSAIETDIFDGKCDDYIEGYRLVGEDEIWVREDGEKFTGVMASPWKPYQELDLIQRLYEKNLLAEYAEALKTVGVSL